MQKNQSPRRDSASPHLAWRGAFPDLSSFTGIEQKATRVRTLTAETDFSSLEAQWDRLHASAQHASVFSSWAWQYQWWQKYGKGQPLRLLVARQGTEIVGLLALYVQTGSAIGVGVRTLRFVGTGGDTGPDDLGPVLARGRETAVAEALAEEAFRLEGWDVLQLTDMPADCAFARALDTAARLNGVHAVRDRSEQIAFVDLPANWDQFLLSLHGDRRYRIRSTRKKLANAHATRFFVWDDAARLDDAVDRLVLLHRKRWQVSGESRSFSTPEYIGFHRSIVKACLARGWLRLYCLEVAGEIAAMTYCYRFRNQIFVMQAGFDPDLAKLKPGHVLLMHAIEHAIAEGNERFDFLRGQHRYKDELANASRETIQLTAFRPHLAAWAYRTRRVYLPAWKAQVRAAAASLPFLADDEPKTNDQRSMS